MNSVTGQFDPGLQPERTALAWQRSALALAGASVVLARVTFQSVGPLTVVVVLLGITHAAVIFATSRRHYRSRRQNLLARWPTAVHGALLVAQVLALSAMELIEIASSGT